MKWDALVFVLFLAITLSACSAGGKPVPAETPAPTPAPIPAATPTPEPAPAPDPIAQAVGSMTLEEKVGQLFLVGFEGTSLGGDIRHYMDTMRPGGVIFFGRNVESAGQLVAVTNELKGLNQAPAPLFVGTDQEGGLVERMPPEVKQLPNAYDVTDAALFGATLGAECRAFGFNMDFAPSLDVWSNPQNTVIGKRAFSNDWEVVAWSGPLAASSISQVGVIPVVKHFPGHGDTATDSHQGLPVVTKTLQELKQSDLAPFAVAMSDQGVAKDLPGIPVGAVMVGHIVLEALDPQRPASLSPVVLGDLLREDLGFEGVIFTDDMTMGAITKNYGLGEACVLSLEAGCDVLLVCHGRKNIQAAYDAVLEAAQSGRLTQDRLDESVYRILTLKAAYDLTDAPVGPADVDALNELVAQVWSGVE